eukprot:gb/GFBE01005873.1/.p1 GENE.gb/GFBE01005873.1/~~gb/GFBE01005873.1/.p1  ORF type:complete len:520 (+),score=112.41 gb/GFBE01005873.1/:1-1560(+)
MVFRAPSLGLRNLLGGRRSSKEPEKSTTPRGRSSAPAGKFKIVLPDGSRPGQQIRVQGPDGREVEVTIPAGAVPGQTLMVEIQPGAASASSASSSSPSSDVVDLVRVLEQDAEGAVLVARQRLSEEMQLQLALWASAEDAARSGSALEGLVGGPAGGDLQIAGSQPEFSQTQAIVQACAEVGDAAQLLAALAEAKQFSSVSISLEDAARALRAAEETMLTWRCLRQAVVANDRHEIQVWIEQAASMGLEVPPGINEVLNTLRGQEQAELQNLEKRREVEQRLQFAQEAGDPELLAQVQAEAAALGIDGRPAPPPPAPPPAAGGDPGKAPPSPRFAEPSPPPPPQPPAAEQPSATAPEQQEAPQQEQQQEQAAQYDTRTTKELLEECRQRGWDTTGCQTREDLINLLQNPPKADAQAPPRPTPQPAAPRPLPTASSQAPTVWDRRSVPPRFLIHKRYESLYLLGLDPARLPSASELRSAYRRSAMESHPDKQQNHGRQDAAKELFQRVKDAFDHLNEVVR